MFKLPNPPSPQASVHELTDFVELQAWNQGTYSMRQLAAFLGRIDDNEFNEGCEDDDLLNEEASDEVMMEITWRTNACEEGYPFEQDESGTIVKYMPQLEEDVQSIIYRYLLLSTRLDMIKHGKNSGINGSELLEEISASALLEYIGGNGEALVFGTSVKGNFEDKVNTLCERIGEGGLFRNLDGGIPTAKDGKLDVVVWNDFSDNLHGKLIVFGQCKTGTNWKDTTAQLRPDGFIKLWIRDPYRVDPVAAFCISEAAARSHWSEFTVYGGILFDRCRLVEFGCDIEQELIDRIAKWSDAARSHVPIW